MGSVDQSNKDDSLCAAPVDLSGDPLGGAFSVHGPVAPALRSASAAHATARRASALRPVATPALRMMADQPDQVIDFGKVGFTDAENQMRTLVFQPEGGETEPESRCRVNWDVKLEQALNDHINVEYTASYAYHALFSYFDRDTVGLDGFQVLCVAVRRGARTCRAVHAIPKHPRRQGGAEAAGGTRHAVFARGRHLRRPLRL